MNQSDTALSENAPSLCTENHAQKMDRYLSNKDGDRGYAALCEMLSPQVVADVRQSIQTHEKLIKQ